MDLSLDVLVYQLAFSVLQTTAKLGGLTQQFNISYVYMPAWKLSWSG